MPNPTPGRSHPFHAAPAPGVSATGTVTTVEDIRRAYYETADYSMWVTEVQAGPAGLALIVCDDDSGDLFRIPVTTGPGGVVTFGPAAPVLVDYVPAPPGSPPGPGPGTAPNAAAYPQGRRIAAAWNTRDASRAGLPGPVMARPGRAGLAALAWAARHGGVAAAADEDTWRALFGNVKQPDPAATDKREASPLTLAEYRALYPDDPGGDPVPGPVLPGLAGYVPPPKLAPAEQPPPQPGLASARRAAADAQTAGQIGTIGIIEHGEIDGGAFHTHAHGHPGSEANGHEHQHVHQPGAGGLHTIGPGHDHSGPETFVPDLAAARYPARVPRKDTGPPGP